MRARLVYSQQADNVESPLIQRHALNHPWFNIMPFNQCLFIGDLMCDVKLMLTQWWLKNESPMNQLWYNDMRVNYYWLNVDSTSCVQWDITSCFTAQSMSTWCKKDKHLIKFSFTLPQRTHGVKMTYYGRLCDVVTSHRRVWRRCDVMCLLGRLYTGPSQLFAFVTTSSHILEVYMYESLFQHVLLKFYESWMLSTTITINHRRRKV